MTKEATLIPIGELLTKAGVLSEEHLVEALERAKERGLPLGKVLVMLGYLKQRDLRSAVEAQSLINDGMLSPDLAAKALGSMAGKEMKLTEALTQLGWKKQKAGATNRLGELLVEADAITWEHLDEALKTSQETGLPVGRVLVFRKSISNAVLLACLTAQKLIREGVINRDQAVQGLRAVRQRQIGFEESLAQSGYYRPPARRTTPLGYLLVEAAILDEGRLMECMELSLTEEKPIGEVFIERKYISRALLKAALKIQEMLENHTISSNVAAAALKRISLEGISVVKAVAESGMPSLSKEHQTMLTELLSLSGVVDANELQQLLGPELRGSADLLKDLLASDTVSEGLLYAMLRALYFIDNKLIVQEDAIMAIHQCKKNNVTFDEALKELGWSAPNMTQRKK